MPKRRATTQKHCHRKFEIWVPESSPRPFRTTLPPPPPQVVEAVKGRIDRAGSSDLPGQALSLGCRFLLHCSRRLPGCKAMLRRRLDPQRATADAGPPHRVTPREDPSQAVKALHPTGDPHPQTGVVSPPGTSISEVLSLPHAVFLDKYLFWNADNVFVGYQVNPPI